MLLFFGFPIIVGIELESYSSIQSTCFSPLANLIKIAVCAHGLVFRLSEWSGFIEEARKRFRYTFGCVIEQVGTKQFCLFVLYRYREFYF